MLNLKPVHCRTGSLEIDERIGIAIKRRAYGYTLLYAIESLHCDE